MFVGMIGLPPLGVKRMLDSTIFSVYPEYEVIVVPAKSIKPNRILEKETGLLPVFSYTVFICLVTAPVVLINPQVLVNGTSVVVTDIVGATVLMELEDVTVLLVEQMEFGQP